jgi:hypothetical protein
MRIRLTADALEADGAALVFLVGFIAGFIAGRSESVSAGAGRG